MTTVDAITSGGSRWAAPRRLADLPRWRLVVARVFGVAAIAFGPVYLSWRVSSMAGPSGFALTFWVAELVAYASIVFSVVVLWNRRVRDDPLGIPRGTLDIFVPVCGEPTEMVSETLTAALAIAYPHETWLLNDGRLAGKDNWRAIEELARLHGVRCLTRTEGGRGKAANLNHALSRSSGDFVGVIDADHRADADFAHETLGYFDDRRVALVTTPQLFELSGEDVLNNLEPFFYGCVQPAKDAANAAFSCGNGVVYRRSALAEIAGFSEWNLVEDLHTSYRLHAAGFQSVYHPRAVTIGTAPATAAGAAKQRLTWAIDSLRILFFDSPCWKRGLTFAQRLHYLQTTSSYLTGIVQITFWIAPFVYLLLQLSAIRGAQAGTAYLGAAGPYYGAVFAWVIAFVGVRNTLRSVAQRTFLAPIFLVATLKAASGRRLATSVTEKVAVPRFSLLLLPMIAMVALTALSLGHSAVTADRQMTVAMAVAAVTTILMSGILTAMTPDDRKRRRWRLAAAAGTALVCVAFVFRAF